METPVDYSFSRYEVAWLEAGMQFLVNANGQDLSIDALSKETGISRTSFYHLFSSRQKFMIRLCQFWVYTSTVSLFESLKDIERPEEQLKALIIGIKRDKLEGQTWIRLKQIGRNNEYINKMLKDVESLRLKTVGKMIHSIGYSEETSRKKAKAFMYYYFGRIMLEWSEGYDDIPEHEQITEVLEAVGIKF